MKFMTELSLKNAYNSYKKDRRILYGGSQMLSPDKAIRKCGCGLIAAADLFFYMHRHTEGCRCPLFDRFDGLEHIETADFIPLYRSLAAYFAIVPPFGINGMMLALGINLFFRKYDYPYIARWGVAPSMLWYRIGEMLDNDLPVIITVGKDFPRIWQKHSTDLYSETASGHVKSSKVRAHFMTLTGLDESWMHVSSWGRRYSIKRSDYEEFIKDHSSSLLCNIISLRKA